MSMRCNGQSAVGVRVRRKKTFDQHLARAMAEERRAAFLEARLRRRQIRLEQLELEAYPSVWQLPEAA